MKWEQANFWKSNTTIDKQTIEAITAIEREFNMVDKCISSDIRLLEIEYGLCDWIVGILHKLIKLSETIFPFL